MRSTRATNRHDWIVGIAVLVGFLILLIGAALLLLPDYWYLWILLVIGGVLLYNGWHTHNYAYSCVNCSQTFEISFWTNFFAPHGVDSQGTWTSLKCPHCGRRTHARIVTILPEPEEHSKV